MNRAHHLLILLLGFFCTGTLWAQINLEGHLAGKNDDKPGSTGSCASDELLRRRNPAAIERDAAVDRRLYMLLDQVGKHGPAVQGADVYSIPVVVHIIHDGGSENISDAQVLAGIRHMNEAFANVGVYDPTTGVDVGIQFCLAKQDPNGAFTTGITRTRSSLTVETIETDDIPLKNLTRWNPRHYLNIWLVREIVSASVGPGVAGYAYFPSSHGSSEDGIVGEARWFGSSPDNSKMYAHEAGHYLGLYHTFQGGCRNNDCLADGDMVCDTPPDGSTAGLTCGVPFNSCTTDVDDISVNNPFRPAAVGGLGDQNDLYADYMDYGRWECYTLFTQGQRERMRAVLTTIRSSLLESTGCLSPCTRSLIASFSASSQAVSSGTTVTFANTSTGANTYEWRVDGVVIATSTNASHTFNAQGRHVVVLRAFNGEPACTDEDTVIIDVACQVRASFTAGSRTIQPGESVTFTNTSTGATSYQWLVNGVSAGTGRDLQQTFIDAGGYRVVLMACNGTCCDTSLGILVNVGLCRTSSRWNIWYFGYGAGIDFNSGQPVVLTDGKLYAKDGTSTICDIDGNLLFYSDGDTIWNRRHQVMMNGTGLWGREAATHSATIAPVPNSDSLYYVFTVTDWWQTNTGIRYSIVDMSLDGGLGGVTAAKNVPLHGNVSDQVALAMHANCRDIWVVTHEMNNDRFLSYLLTSSGISQPPVITDVGPKMGNAMPRFGYLKFSSDGKRLCNSLGANSIDPTLILFDFDNATGVMSNPIVLADNDELRYSYSPEFSLNSRYLYVSNLLKNVLYQFDLAAGSPAQVRASKLLVTSTRDELGGFQMGPDGRIYITSRWAPTISVINYPGQRGTACGFVEGAINLKGRTGSLGLPTRIANASTVRITGSAMSCTGDSLATFSVGSSRCAQGAYTWKVQGDAEIVASGDTTVTVRAKGSGRALLIVEVAGDCGILIDTLAISLGEILAVDLGPDTTLCKGVSVLLDAGPGYVQYRWQDGTGTRTYLATAPGIYWVEITDTNGCTARDTVQVFPGAAITTNLGSDTALCDGGVMVLDAGPGALRYRWQDGSPGRTYSAYRPGTYWVEVLGPCGTVRDTVVILEGSPAINLGSDTVLCNGVDLLLDAGPGFESYRWQDGSTGRTFHALAPGVYIVRARVGGCESIGTIRVESGTPIAATVLLDEPSPAALSPGARIAIPLRIMSAAGQMLLQGKVFRASIRFNKTLLLPIGGTSYGTVQGSERIVTVIDTVRDSDTLALLQFEVMLGDTDRATLAIDTFHVESDCIADIALMNGTITVDICENLGARLLRSTGATSLSVRSSQPAAKNVVVHYSLAEAGNSRLTLVDLLGRRIRVLLDEESGIGKYVLPLDVHALDAGVYFLVLETPTQCLVERMFVVQ